MQDIPSIMRAVRIENHSLRLIEHSVPQPKDHEVLIKVHAAGINRADLFQVEGNYPYPEQTHGIPGLEIAGEIVAYGTHVTQWHIGDRVCGIISGGGYAEYTCADAEHLLPVPSDFSMIEAASFPEALATTWLALFIHGQIQPHETTLIHGGSSGIGVTAIQMLRSYGITVFTTAGSSQKCNACSQLGAQAINYKEEDFVTHIKSATQSKGVDIILDMVGGDYIERNIRCLAPNGRLISIAFLQGANIKANMAGLLMKNASWKGIRLLPQPSHIKANIMQALQQKIWPEILSGKIIPVINATYSLEEAEKAHQTMYEGLHIGKIILNIHHH